MVCVWRVAGDWCLDAGRRRGVVSYIFVTYLRGSKILTRRKFEIGGEGGGGDGGH